MCPPFSVAAVRLGDSLLFPGSILLMFKITSLLHQASKSKLEERMHEPPFLFYPFSFLFQRQGGLSSIFTLAVVHIGSRPKVL